MKRQSAVRPTLPTGLQPGSPRSAESAGPAVDLVVAELATALDLPPPQGDQNQGAQDSEVHDVPLPAGSYTGRVPRNYRALGASAWRQRSSCRKGSYGRTCLCVPRCRRTSK